MQARSRNNETETAGILLCIGFLFFVWAFPCNAQLIVDLLKIPFWLVKNLKSDFEKQMG